MTAKQLHQVEHALNQARAIALSRLRRQRDSIDSTLDDEVGDPVDHALIEISRGTEHMLLELDWIRLQRIDAAQRRLARGRHGVCVRCGETIDWRRLSALPEASLCIDCATNREPRFAD